MASVSRFPVLGLLFLISAVGTTQALDYALVPISASGAHSIAGDEILLQGGGQTVIFEIKVSDWDPTMTTDRLKTWQATIDSSGYTSGAMGSISPRVVACADNVICVAQFGDGAVCENLCSGGTNDGSPCNASPECPGGTCDPTRCSAGFQDLSRADWVLGAAQVVAAVSTADLDYGYGATVVNGAPPLDDGTSKYGGTLIVDVSANAAGTFTVGFLDDPGATFGLSHLNALFSITTQPAMVTIQCLNAGDCNDNNACTTDTCNAQNVCVNAPNYNPAVSCCNPNNGNLTTLSDGIECTDDMCDVDTGIVTHPPEPIGTACGNQSNSQCDAPDSCDGAGSCNANVLPAGTACGSPTNTDCNLADTCNGAGTCQTNIQPAGTACGDPSSGPCNNPDTCNGLGSCLVNQVANGTPCDDGLFCTMSTTCMSGACAGGMPTNCADSLTCTTDSCNEGADVCDHTLNANSCLIMGACYTEGMLNPSNTCEICESATSTSDWTVLPDDTVCNDGDACTGTGRPGIGVDMCTAGVCEGTVDPECNDQCEFAVPAVEGVNTSNNASTGPDDGEASCQPDSNGDVWFQYTAVCDGLIFLSTTGSDLMPLNDPVLNVFDDCPINGGTEIACDDDSGLDLNAALTFAATSGLTYFIRVAGFETNVGDIVLNLRPFDDCLIDGVCYEEDELNPENPCQACLPDLTTTQWSNLPEAVLCGDTADTECDGPDTCNGLGVCEINNKPDGTNCSDEMPANVCTDDVCSGGTCTHPPVGAGVACGDATDTDCDNPDTCDGGGSCVPNFEDAGFACGDQSTDECDNPDICDGTGGCLDNFKDDGTPCDDFDVCTESEICETGVCVGVPIPQAPIVAAAGPLLLNVTPQPGGSAAPVALRLTSPRWTCIDKYISSSGMLVDLPEFQLPDDWGTVLVHGPEIYPSAMGDPSEYEVVAECGSFVSPAGLGATSLWGDLDNDGDVDFVDINLILDEFKTVESFTEFDPVFDLDPCPPDGHLSFRDITIEVSAFKGDQYPCPPPCP